MIMDGIIPYAKLKALEETLPVMTANGYYGVSDTAADTAYKTVTIEGFTTLAAGVKVTVKFTAANTATSPTLNVSGTGATSIMVYGTTASASGAWNAGSVVDFVYDGTNWVISGVAAVDTTLTASGVAADAASVGVVKSALDDVEDVLAIPVNRTVSGDDPASATNFVVMSGIELKEGHVYALSVSITAASDNPVYAYLVSSGGTSLRSVTIAAGNTSNSANYTATDDYSDCVIKIGNGNRNVSYTVSITEPGRINSIEKLQNTIGIMDTNDGIVRNALYNVENVLEIPLGRTVTGEHQGSPNAELVMENINLSNGRTYVLAASISAATDKDLYLTLASSGGTSLKSVTVAAGNTSNSANYTATDDYTGCVLKVSCIRDVVYTASIQASVAEDNAVEKMQAAIEQQINLYDAELDVGTITNGYMIAGTTGTAVSNDASACTDYVPVIGGMTITLKGIYIAANRSVYAYDSNQNPLRALATGSSDTTKTITLGDDVAYIRITSVSGKTPSGVYTNDVIQKRIENLENADGTYQRFAYGNPIDLNRTENRPVADFEIHGCNLNARPTPDNRNPVNQISPPYLYHGGKNLLPVSASVQGSGHGITYTLNDDKSVTVSGDADSSYSRTIGSVLLMDGHTYTLSGMFANDTGCYLFVTLPGSVTKKDYGSGITFTMSGTAACNVSLYLTSSFVSADGETVYPQVEINEQPTEYEQYKGTSFDLTGITLKPFDVISKQNGVWVHDAVASTVVTFDGDEAMDTTGKAYYANLSSWDNTVPYVDAVCDAFTPAAKWDDVTNGRHDDTFIVYKNSDWTYARVAFYSTRWASLNDFKAWLTTHPITVAYKNDGTVTRTEVSSALQNKLNDVSSYKDGTVLCADSGAYLTGYATEEAIDIVKTYMESDADYKRPIVTIVDDDGQTSAYTVLKPLCDSKGIKCTMALITDNIGNNASYMTLAQVLELRDDGYDLVSHTKTHANNIFSKNYANFSLVTDAAVMEELVPARDWIVKYGLNDKVLVFPHGNFPEQFDATCNNPDPDDSDVCGAYNQAERYCRLAREAGYSYALNSTGGIIEGNKAFNDMYIPRAEVVDSDGLDYWKGQIDKVVASNGWMIIITHMWSTVLTSEFLGNVIDYALSKGCEFKTFADAIKVKHNSIAAGMFTDPHGYYVGADGNR